MSRQAQLDERALLAAIDETVDFIFVTDDVPLEFGGPNITYANSAFALAVGYSREELLGMKPAAFFGPETDATALYRLRSDLRAQRTAVSELLIYRRDGSAFWAEFAGRPFFEDGAFRGWIAVGRDVEQRRERSLAVATRSAAVEAASDPVAVYDACAGNVAVIEYVNPAFTRIFGFTPQEIVGCAADVLYGEMTDQAQLRYMRGQLREGVPARGTIAMYGKDAQPHRIEMSVNPVTEGGRVVRWVAVMRDVTSQEQYRASMQAERRRLHATLRCVSTPLILMNAEEQIEFANTAAEKLFGREWTSLYGLRLQEAIDLQQAGETAHASAPSSETVTYRAMHMRGDEVLILDVAVSPVSTETDRFDQYVVAFTDVSADVAKSRRLTYEAMHDPLTGLLNRRGFDMVTKAALTAGAPGDTHAIVVLDLNHFKPMNDLYGHNAGDRYLCALADLLRNGVRRGDEVARLGGDEFVVFLTKCDESDAERLATKLAGAIGDLKVPWDGHKLQGSTSYGCAVLRFGGSVQETLHAADMRLYQQKRKD
jgi:diguanylate cyclase (GGDEF)-like protein/PAS domain S-box-containing protein